MIVKIITTENEFSQLKNEWTTLHKSSRTQSLFLTWEWMYQWWLSYSKKMSSNHKLCIITARDSENNLQSIWPFFTIETDSSRWKLKILKFIGTNFESSDYLDIIVNHKMTEDHFKAVLGSNVFKEIVESIDKIILNNVLDNSIVYKYKSHFEYLKWQRRNAICPYLSLPNDKEELLNSLSKNMKSGLRRTYNKLTKNPDIQIRTVVNKIEINKAIESLFQLQRERFNNQDKDTKFTFSQRGSFHQQIAKIFLEKNWLQFYEVLFKEEVIGSLYCYLYGTTLMYFQAGFNPNYAQYALGNQLILHAISDAINLNCTEFDFMRGDEAYKYKWTSTERYLYTLEFGCSAKGKLQIAKKNISKNIKKRIKKVIQKK